MEEWRACFNYQLCEKLPTLFIFCVAIFLSLGLVPQWPIRTVFWMLHYDSLWSLKPKSISSPLTKVKSIKVKSFSGLAHVCIIVVLLTQTQNPTIIFGYYLLLFPFFKQAIDCLQASIITDLRAPSYYPLLLSKFQPVMILLLPAFS